MDNITVCEIINAYRRGYVEAVIAAALDLTVEDVVEALTAHPELLKEEEEYTK